MASRRALVYAVLLGAVALSGCGRRGGVVFMGAGETISHRADLTPEGRALVQEETGLAEPAVGFKYEYFSIFFLDVWTGGGEVVLYDEALGDRYVEVTEEELLSFTGVSSEELGKPFLYRFPLGWFVILLVVGGVVFVTWRNMRELG